VKIRGWGNENINIKNKSVDKINTESSLAIAQKLSSLWPWEPSQTLSRRKSDTNDVGGSRYE
jgi:hypothetical protein